MALITITYGGNPAISQVVEESDFRCFDCDQVNDLEWCEWCGQWECNQHLCCRDCGGHIHGGECP